MTRYEIALGKKPPVQITDKCYGESILKSSIQEYLFMKYYGGNILKDINEIEMRITHEK
jgi:hypothetical protein